MTEWTSTEIAEHIRTPEALPGLEPQEYEFSKEGRAGVPGSGVIKALFVTVLFWCVVGATLFVVVVL
ncbi:hypothetical protein ROJ8625_04130 [Roseivivax jejudonensis]|uniref:Uncharacterized protein n=2 Tax=Roseivivax jejudonensis TaxID=1529041 RepID=A0A1X7ABF6_9RHOB|nr:hypothetical protein ROJ8625_04130 [Roseivivax jejudonensis]